MLVPVAPKTKCLAVRDVPSKFGMILERAHMVRVQFNSFRPAALACGIVAADDRVSPCFLLVRAIRVTALPVGVVLTICVAPFDATLMATKPLLSEGRDRLVILDGELLSAILADFAANTTLPEGTIFPRPTLGPPFVPTSNGSKSDRSPLVSELPIPAFYTIHNGR